VAPSELLREVADTFDRIGIPHFITGSVASIAYGEFRSTAVVDIVATVTSQHVARICAVFDSDRYYISPQAIQDAIPSHGQFKFIDSETGYKADIMIPRMTPYERQRFGRTTQIRPTGHHRTYTFSSPEDVILKKLESFKEGQSDKHLRDVAGILKVMGEQLDQTYINRWGATLGVTEIWQAVLDRVGQK
jgi:hypothetical protein